MHPAGARTQPAPYRAQHGARPGAADRRDHLADADPAGPLITDAATQTGWDGARDSAAGPCRTLVFASCSGRPGATAAALRSAQDVIAEIGVDMTVFATASHLVSWAKWCPQVARSGGKRKGSNAAGRGNPYLSAALGEISISASRTQSFPGAKYRRLVKRMPKKKALVATGNSVLTIFHALLSDPAATYHDLGPGYYEQRTNTRRQARNHVKGLERLGYHVTIQAINPGTGELLTATA